MHPMVSRRKKKETYQRVIRMFHPVCPVKNDNQNSCPCKESGLPAAYKGDEDIYFYLYPDGSIRMFDKSGFHEIDTKQESKQLSEILKSYMRQV